MIRGSCLCGEVRFEVDRAAGPFELCHCTRCRKASGSAFVAGVGVRDEDFRWVAGNELIRTYEAPLRKRPPAYQVTVCARCGSPLPSRRATTFEVPAGLLDDDPCLRPERHIIVDRKSSWFDILDSLPQLTARQLARLRKQTE